MPFCDAVRDRLYSKCKGSTDPRAKAAFAIAKCMNVLQDDYTTRLVTVGIKGAYAAELFAIGPESFMSSPYILEKDTKGRTKKGKHGKPKKVTALYDYIAKLNADGTIDTDLTAHLHTARVLGNNARHALTPPFTAADKPRMANSVFALARFADINLHGPVPIDPPSPTFGKSGKDYGRSDADDWRQPVPGDEQPGRIGPFEGLIGVYHCQQQHAVLA